MKFENLRKLREELGLTQEEFAKSLGLSKTTYNNYEIGVRDPRSDFWCKVADTYSVSVDFLLGVSNEKRPAPQIEGELSDIITSLAKKMSSMDQDQLDALETIADLVLRLRGK